MNRVYARLAAAALAAVLVFGATSADAANKNTVGAALHDCGQGHDPLAGHYSVKVLQTALHDLHTNSLQYTTCADALQNAINSQLAKPTHNVVKQRVNRVKKLGGAPFLLPSGQSVTPGAVTVHSASFLSSLPTPLLIVLAALLAAVAAVGGRALHQLVRTRRSH
jgi:hypothetical protein